MISSTWSTSGQVSFFFFFLLILPNVFSHSWLQTDKADSKRHLITAKSAAAPRFTTVNNYGDWLSFSPSLTEDGSHATNSQHQAVMRFVWFPLNASHPMSFLIFNCFDGSSETTPFPIKKYRPLSAFCFFIGIFPQITSELSKVVFLSIFFSAFWDALKT